MKCHELILDVDFNWGCGYFSKLITVLLIGTVVTILVFIFKYNEYRELKH